MLEVALAENFPDEKDGIRGFVQHLADLADEADRFEKLKGELDLGLFPVEFPKMWEIRDKTLADLLDEYVADPSLEEALAAMSQATGRRTRKRRSSGVRA